MIIELPNFSLMETDTMEYKPANPVLGMDVFLRSSRATESGERNYIWMKVSQVESSKWNLKSVGYSSIPAPLATNDKRDKAKRQNACGDRDKNEQMWRYHIYIKSSVTVWILYSSNFFVFFFLYNQLLLRGLIYEI